MQESRLKKSLLNARVNLIFYFLNLAISFFSRKIFLESLGAEFIGLTSTLYGILGFLNLAELGVGTAIGYVLYKPLLQKNHLEINQIISVLGYLYRIIGIITLGIGALISCFFPIIFTHTSCSYSIIYTTFYIFLTSSLLSYFVNYKQSLLGADQRNYIVAGYYQTTNILCYLIQIILVYYTQSPFAWIIINLVSSIIYCIILNQKIRKVYPWLETDVELGHKILKKYPEVTQYIKQIFIHRIAGFVQIQTKPLLIYGFVSLETVAFYGNYAIILDKVSALITNCLNSTSSGVGNLIAEGNKSKIYNIFWELFVIRILTTGIIVFSIYHLLEPFISLWLGSGYLLNHSILILVLISLFIEQTRGTTEQFLFGYGLFSDIWAPIIELSISLIIALTGGFLWGLNGILLGPIISMSLVVCIWKPFFLYSRGFKRRIFDYWITVGKFLILLFLSLLSCSIIIKNIPTNPYKSYIDWTIYAITIIPIFTIIYTTLLYISSKSVRDVATRILISLKNSKR